MKMKLRQEFDLKDMPLELVEKVCKYFNLQKIYRKDEKINQVNDDIYERWYPSNVDIFGEWHGRMNRTFDTIDEEHQFAVEMNEWLIENGMDWDKLNSHTYKYFHVLIHCNYY